MQRYPTYNLLQHAFFRVLARRETIGLFRVVVVFVFVLAIAAGLFGAQNPYANIITTLVWVIWWMGYAFVCALIGNLWQLTNPLDTVFASAERAFATVTGGRQLSLGLTYPEPLGAWPAVIVFFGFAWAEPVWANNDVPAPLAYAVFTWAAILGRLAAQAGCALEHENAVCDASARPPRP